MPQLTEDQIVLANSIDLLAYLQTHAPHMVRKSGADEYCLAEHDSFKMSNGKWYWHSRGFGGHTALCYLRKVEGMGYVEAVQHLTGDNAPTYRRVDTSAPKTSPPKIFKLPEAHHNNDKVYAYLRGRGIGKEVINRCFSNGSLYQSTKGHCVFVGRDENGTAKFAWRRSTKDSWQKDVWGSKKTHGFCLPPKNPADGNALAVFEAPIDLLAHCTIQDMMKTGWDGHRLSLGGVSLLALHSFLERHPNINHVILCLDNDERGVETTSKIIDELSNNERYKSVKISVRSPPFGKDYADTLKALCQQQNIRSPTRHQVADISI